MGIGGYGAKWVSEGRVEYSGHDVVRTAGRRKIVVGRTWGLDRGWKG